MICVASPLEWHLGLLGAPQLPIRDSEDEEEKMRGDRNWSGGRRVEETGGGGLFRARNIYSTSSSRSLSCLGEVRL